MAMEVQVTTTLAVSTVFLIISFLFCVLRCYGRYLVRSFGLDDILVLVSWLAASAITVIIYEEKKAGLGKDVNTLAETEISQIVRLSWASVICFIVGLTIVKNSALLQCLRFILIGKMRYFCWFLVIFISLSGFITIWITIFQCQPVSYYWHQTPGHKGKCFEIMPFWLFGTAALITTDILVVVIPILTVKDLTLGRKQKTALIIIFGFGIFAVLASFLRILSSIILASSLKTDPSKTDAVVTMWSAVELNIGIICVCAPPLKPVVLRIAPSLLRGRTTTPDVDNFQSNLSGDTVVDANDRVKEDQLQPQLQPQPVKLEVRSRTKSTVSDMIIADEGHLLDV